MLKQLMLVKLPLLLLTIISFLGSSFVYAHGPSRLKVKESITIDAPAEKVWKTVGAFDSLTWLPPVTKVVMEKEPADQKGAVRVVYVGEQSVTEQLKKLDKEGMLLKYKISKNNTALLPVTNYQSTITVKADGDKSIVTWKAGFYRGDPNNDPPENLNDETAIGAIVGLYKVGLENLKVIMEQ
ncbi:SRPBCC family protein [Enterovibrio makurazakiensis]|uniref:SRPBCC family protein n=1 Tax=Enterovibrio gelatinilyticus TaxID=2899819 RepID=A0ABT5QXR9_9GAMM|nr:SRPBCC family protein [Enterovibrio sp. ZSDZ42]MDD1792789.1 SRPBCC family protein [Enterovibrio sp. ZSDZ42]